VSSGQFPPAVRVGPLFVPGGGACHWCLEQHARERYPLYDELAAWRTARPPYAATLGPASGLVGSMLAMEVVHHLTGLCRPATLDTALIGDLRTGVWTAEPVERHAACPWCGPA
jgi:bacteriocin biosynthesis cyclodehydratase domain-containing protein